MITILYFAKFREKLGLDQESLALPEKEVSVQDILDQLAARGGIWQELLDCDQVMVAINQELVSRGTSVYEDDELAVFPPVTGG